MQQGRLILNENIGITNRVSFDDFHKLAIQTLEDIVDNILPLCGPHALNNLVIYQSQADDFGMNVFSNDGIHILKKTEYVNPTQTYIANYIRYIAERVERAASDGTSTAIYLAASLVINLLIEVKKRREREVDPSKELSPFNLYRLMLMTNIITDDAITFLNQIREEIKAISINLDDVDVEIKRKLIYELALTSSKGDTKLTEFTTDQFMVVPKELYNNITYKRSPVETKEAFAIEIPEHDTSISVVASANTQYNSKLQTELVYDDCDILIVPNMFTSASTVVEYLNFIKDTIEKHLVVVYLGGNDNDIVNMERTIDPKMMTLCRYTATAAAFINNPLELYTIMTMADITPRDQINYTDLEESTIRGVKCRLYGNSLYISDLFDHTTDPIHPNYIHKNNKHYNKFCDELAERLVALQDSHLRSRNTDEINEFTRIYRNMVCSRLPYLIIGGSTTEHLSNINVVQDVLGVVSVAMEHGVVVDLIPKLCATIKKAAEGTSDTYDYFINAVQFFEQLTYGLSNEKADVVDSIFNMAAKCKPDTLRLSALTNNGAVSIDGNADDIKVVQSVKAIDETLKRLIETIPRIIRINSILVENGVMVDKKE
jgi:hypothetical protein